MRRCVQADGNSRLRRGKYELRLAIDGIYRVHNRIGPEIGKLLGACKSFAHRSDTGGGVYGKKPRLHGFDLRSADGRRRRFALPVEVGGNYYVVVNENKVVYAASEKRLRAPAAYAPDSYYGNSHGLR